MFKIEIVKKVKSDVSALLVARVLKAVSAVVKVKGRWEVTLIIVGSSEIKKINQKFRGKNKVTDVLSFSSLVKGFVAPKADHYLGEVIICYSELERQAKKHSWPTKNELALLLTHGLLHLLGHHHESSKKEAEKMEKLEKNILTKIGIKEPFKV